MVGPVVVYGVAGCGLWRGRFVLYSGAGVVYVAAGCGAPPPLLVEAPL